jgi:hypothetical protein
MKRSQPLQKTGQWLTGASEEGPGSKGSGEGLVGMDGAIEWFGKMPASSEVYSN